MNKITDKIEDVQNSPDKRHLDIDKVGIKSIRHPISVKDKTGGDQSTVAMFDMYVHLPHNFKGTHMSRFVEILNENERTISVKNFEKILRENNSSADIETVKSENLSGKNSQVIDYFINRAGSVIQGRAYLFEVENRVMIINCTAKDLEFEKIEPTLEKIVDSFNVED